MKITFVVNSFNRRALLTESLRSLSMLIQCPRWDATVVVYDAGSSDGSIEVIEQTQSALGQERLQIVLPNPGDDTSFAAGLNAACEVASKRFDPDYYAFFETDNFADSEQPFLQAIELLKENSGLAAAGFTVSLKDGSPCGFGERTPNLLAFAFGTRFADFLGLRNPKLIWSYSQIAGVHWSYCDVVYTSPLVIRANVWRNINGMDARSFPFAACDLDLAWRLKNRGLAMAVVRAAGVYHDNLGQLSAWSARRAYSFHQGTFRLLRRYRGRVIWLIAPILAMRHLCEAVVFLVSGGDASIKKSLSRLKLILAALRGYPA